MNKQVTSKQEILEACRAIVAELGVHALNMRNVAKRCDVAVGSLYNYFSSKDDLMTQVVESIWEEIVFRDFDRSEQSDFLRSVGDLFRNISTGSQRYPLFLMMHSMNIASSDKMRARQAMKRFFSLIEQRLLEVLDKDPRVDQEIFTAEFSKEEYVRFIFSSILTAIVDRSESCLFLLELIRRTIYK